MSMNLHTLDEKKEIDFQDVPKGFYFLNYSG